MPLSKFIRQYWVRLAFLFALPLVLYLFMAERMSWQPRVLHAGRDNEVVTTLAYAPDGKRLAVGLNRGEETQKIQLWDVPAAELRQVILLNTHHELSRLALATNGNIAGGYPDLSHGFRSLMLWSPEGQPHQLREDSKYRRLEGYAPFVFAPDGQRLFSISRSYRHFAGATEIEGLRVVTWDAQHGTVLHSSLIVPPQGHYLSHWDCSAYGDSGPACALSPSGRWGVIQTWTASPKLNHYITEDGGLLLFDARSGVAQHILILKPAYVQPGLDMITFSPDEQQLMIPDFSHNRIQFWATQTGHLLRQVTLKGHTDGSPLACSPDRKLMATGGYDMWDHRVLLWDTQTGQLQRKLPLPMGSINCLAFASDGATLATGQRNTVKLWRIK